MSQQQTEHINQQVIKPETLDYEFDFIYLVKALGEEKWLLFGVPSFCVCIATVISLYLTPIYTAKATFIVSDKQQSSSSSLATLEQLGGLAGSLSRSSSEIYTALMQSNSVQDVVIAELDLINYYQSITIEDARKKLISSVNISIDKKSGLIIIEAKDQSPEIATKLANAYLKPFRDLQNRLSLEEAHARSQFFAQQTEVLAQRKFRDPSVQTVLMTNLIRQYEAARIDEARKPLIIFSVDIAQKPEKRSWPKRGLLVGIAGAISLFFTLIIIFLKITLFNIKNDPISSLKWYSIKKAWKLRL
jgi:uncharacterized protein involved in exopolysaccharide biosynthesis